MTDAVANPAAGPTIGVLGIAAVGEATTGLVLLVHPPTLVRLLFGAESSDVTGMMSRIAGMALVGLGAACWPNRAFPRGSPRSFLGMLIYSLLVTIYLFVLGVERGSVGLLLWPAALLHAALTILLGREWLRVRTD